MSDIKEVSVALTPADEEVLSRPLTRRRRTRKSAAAALGLEGGQLDAPTPAPSTMVVKDGADTTVPAATQPVASQLPTAAPTVAVVPPTLPTVAPVESGPKLPVPTPATGGGGFRIQTRKRTHGSKSAAAPMTRKNTTVIAGGAKILSSKRHALPTSKPKLIVPLVGGSGAAAANTVAKPAVPTVAPVVPQTGGAMTRGRRRFTERRLSISMKQDKSTRKAGRKVRRQVRRMTVEEIRKVLLEKKILKPKSNPPEAMLRSMMRDYLALKH